MKILNVICKIVTILIVLCLVAMAGLFLGPKIAGYKTMAVISGSMEPNIGVGSLVLAKETECAELVKDDVVTYMLNDGTRVTHRVMSNDTEKQLIVTKGDANDAEDASPIAYSNIIGKVKTSIPIVGYISIYSKTPLGITGICVIVFLLMLTLFLPDILAEDESDKNETTSNVESRANS